MHSIATEILEYRDIDEEDPLEVEASRYNSNYIKLDGNVGCMVNGACPMVQWTPLNLQVENRQTSLWVVEQQRNRRKWF
ncbi:hypothetical protein MASR2M39_06450 [Ignavibacteriales bacterium]